MRDHFARTAAPKRTTLRRWIAAGLVAVGRVKAADGGYVVRVKLAALSELGGIPGRHPRTGHARVREPEHMPGFVRQNEVQVHSVERRRVHLHVSVLQRSGSVEVAHRDRVRIQLLRVRPLAIAEHPGVRVAAAGVILARLALGGTEIVNAEPRRSATAAIDRQPGGERGAHQRAGGVVIEIAAVGRAQLDHVPQASAGPLLRQAVRSVHVAGPVAAADVAGRRQAEAVRGARCGARQDEGQPRPRAHGSSSRATPSPTQNDRYSSVPTSSDPQPSV